MKKIEKELTIKDIFKPINDYLVICPLDYNRFLEVIRNGTDENTVYEVLAIGDNVKDAEVGDYILTAGMGKVPVIDFISDSHLLIRAHMIYGKVAKNYKEAKKESKVMTVEENKKKLLDIN